jgi:hypothetical protein
MIYRTLYRNLVKIIFGSSLTPFVCSIDVRCIAIYTGVQHYLHVMLCLCHLTLTRQVIYRTLYRNLKIEQHKPPLKIGVNTHSPE